MSGPQLVAHLVNRYLALQTVFMSGYTGDVVAAHELAGPTSVFLQKPLTVHELALKIRELLDGP